MSDKPSFVFARAQVAHVERVSPNFARITFAGSELSEFATPGEIFDLRIKLIFPSAGKALPVVPVTNEGWYQSWLSLPEEERGSMRTYSIRELRVDGENTEVVIDFVLHLEPGLSGPAAEWAAAAEVGDEMLIAGPRRGHDWGGIEFLPGSASSVVLVGDETAAPAIARIIEDSSADLRGVAFIEVPSASDFLAINTPAGFEVRWIAREHGEAHGTRLIPTVLDYLGDAVADVQIEDVAMDDLVWETPIYSSLGEEIAASTAPIERYFWIAGESGVVTTLRRHLVKDLGIDRKQVAFMGYWRKGVTMR